MKKLLLGLGVAILISSCVAPIERRVTANPQMFDRLTRDHKEAVRAGVVKEGMSKDAVYLAWGKPARVQMGRREGKNLERWSYNTYQPVYTTSFGFGTGWGGWGGGCGGFGGFGGPFSFGGTGLDYVPVEGRSVEFVNDKVAGFTIPR